MENNSFKKLEQLHSEQFQNSSSANVKRSIDGETGSFKFIGSIIELYSSKMVDTIAAIGGHTHIPKNFFKKK